MHILQLQMHDLKMLRVLAWLWLPDCCVGFEIDHSLGLIWCLQWSACMQHDCILLRVNGDSAVQWKKCRGAVYLASLERFNRFWSMILPNSKEMPISKLSFAYYVRRDVYWENILRVAYMHASRLHRVGVFGASFTFIKREEQKTEYSSMCGEKGWSPSMCRENGMKHLSWTLARESLRTCTSGSLATFSENLLVKKSTSSEFRKNKGSNNNAIDWGCVYHI